MEKLHVLLGNMCVSCVNLFEILEIYLGKKKTNSQMKKYIVFMETSYVHTSLMSIYALNS